MRKNYSDNAIKFSNLRRKFIKKATYTAPLLLSLGSLTKPQVAGGSHVASPMQIPTVPPDGEAPSRSDTFTSDRNSANYNPLFNPVNEWFGTTRFWGGGLFGAKGAYGFDADEEARYIDTYGFAQIQYGLQEPQNYQDVCSGRVHGGRCLGNTRKGYLSLRNSRPGLTDDRKLTEAEYLLTRSFEKDRSTQQADIFLTLVRHHSYSDVRSLIGLDGADNNQIRAHYELAAYNHYTREVLGHEFDLVSLEQAREWQAALDDPDSTLRNEFDPVIRDRMTQLRNYDLNHYRQLGGDTLREQVVRDVLDKISENNECQSIDAVFSQLCGDFDPYRFLPF